MARGRAEVARRERHRPTGPRAAARSEIARSPAVRRAATRCMPASAPLHLQRVAELAREGRRRGRPAARRRAGASAAGGGRSGPSPMKSASTAAVRAGGKMSIASRTAAKRSTRSGGNDDVADAQRREEHLAEGADVDDARVAVEPLQRRDRLALVAVLAVVVVLDASRRRCACAQSRSCSRRDGAHRHAERVLVRRRDVARPARDGTAGDAGRHVQPLVVDRHGHQRAPRPCASTSRAPA